MHSTVTFLGVCGIVYGAYVIFSLGSFTAAHREEVLRKDAEIAAHISEGGFGGLLFRIGRPLFWLVALPVRSVPAALGVALLLLLPLAVMR